MAKQKIESRKVEVLASGDFSKLRIEAHFVSDCYDAGAAEREKRKLADLVHRVAREMGYNALDIQFLK